MLNFSIILIIHIDDSRVVMLSINGHSLHIVGNAAYLLLLVVVWPTGCMAQNQLTHSMPIGSISIVGSNSGAGSAGPADLMTPAYHRRPDEYNLAVNCTPHVFTPAYSVEQPPPTLAVSASPPTGSSSSYRLNWIVRPTERYEYNVAHAPLVAFDIDDSCRVATPASVSATSAALLNTGNFCALVSAKSCSLAQIVLAVRHLSIRSRLFLLRNVAERSAQAGPLLEPNDEISLQFPPGLVAFAYAGSFGSPDRLAQDLRNRTCSVSIHYRLSALDNLINKTSVLFVSVSFILLMIISLSWLVFYYVQRFRYLHAKERLSRRLGNAAKKALTMIPVRILKPGDKDFAWIGDQCAVCIEPYRVSDTVRILPCKHFYHRSCIDPWLLDQRTCPLCKLDILKAVGLALRDRRQRRGRSSGPQDGRVVALADSDVHVDSAAAAVADAAAIEEGAVDYFSMADSVGVISSGGGGIIGCLGGGGRPSITAASSTDDPEALAGVAMVTGHGGARDALASRSNGGGNRGDEQEIMMVSIPTRPESPAMDESVEVCYPLVHNYHQHQQQQQSYSDISADSTNGYRQNFSAHRIL